MRIRLGAALQKHRLNRGLTQAELAEFADLSLKYVGEIERGEANTTIEVLERLAAAVGWNPMETLDGLREPISEGVRVLLLDEVEQMLDRLHNMTKWLQALNPALQPPPQQPVDEDGPEDGRRLRVGRPSRNMRRNPEQRNPEQRHPEQHPQQHPQQPDAAPARREPDRREADRRDTERREPEHREPDRRDSDRSEPERPDD